MSSEPLSSTTPQPLHLRPDLLAIADLIEPSVRVLDIGCGDGALLEYLRDRKQVKGRGIELTEAGVLACVGDLAGHAGQRRRADPGTATVAGARAL